MGEILMQKFLVLFRAPEAVLAGWAKTDPAIKQPAEAKMRADWGKWMSEHAEMIISTEVGGKTMRITPAGVSYTNNEILFCSYVEAASHEAATRAFEGHPHLQITQASIEVMVVRPTGAM